MADCLLRCFVLLFVFGFIGSASDDGPRDPATIHPADGAPGRVEVDRHIYRGDPDDDRQHRQLVGSVHPLRGTTTKAVILVT